MQKKSVKHKNQKYKIYGTIEDYIIYVHWKPRRMREKMQKFSRNNGQGVPKTSDRNQTMDPKTRKIHYIQKHTDKYSHENSCRQEDNGVTFLSC